MIEEKLDLLFERLKKYDKEIENLEEVVKKHTVSIAVTEELLRNNFKSINEKLDNMLSGKSIHCTEQNAKLEALSIRVSEIEKSEAEKEKHMKDYKMTAWKVSFGILATAVFAKHVILP